MREIRPSGSEGGARFNPLSLPLYGIQGITDEEEIVGGGREKVKA